MLKRITLENFFSFGEPTTIELNSDINILVGINGSGKSNFLKALRLLHESVVGEGFEKVFLQEWGGFNNVVNVSTSKKDYIKLSYIFSYRSIQPNKRELEVDPIEVEYTVVIYPAGQTSYFFDEKLRIYKEDDNVYNHIFIDVKNNVGKLVMLTGANAVRGELVNYPNENLGVMPTFSSTELVLRQISNSTNLYAFLKQSIEGLANYNYFNTSPKSLIRQPSIFGTEEKLLPTGENLNAIIQKLKNQYSLEYEKIENLLRDINPQFKDITFNLFGSKSYLLLREKRLANAISIEHLSNGTLNYLLLLAIFFNPKRGKVVCIDEPETSLHPDMINTIADAIKEASSGTQLFIATHSPLLLNAFELDDLLIFEKDEKNQTKVMKRDDEAFEGMLLGQLWLNGQIGGKRW